MGTFKHTHTALPAATLLTAQHTAKLTSSHGYQGVTPTVFVTHTAPAIRLVLNKHNRQKEIHSSASSLLCN